MAITRIRPLLALMTVLLVASLTGAVPGGDAEQGGDAGDSLEDATVLPGPGTYTGTMDGAGDVDWYELPLPEKYAWLNDAHVCAIASVTGPAKADVVLSDGAGGPAVRNVLDTDGTPLVLAGLLNPDVYLGVVPFTMFTLPEEYAFTIETRTLHDLGIPDAGKSKDAGNDVATATVLTEPCVSGLIWPPHKDTADVYAFEAQAGDLILVSIDRLGQDELNLEVLSPTGNVVASILTHDATSITVEETGTWYLRVTLDQASASTTSTSSPGLTTTLGHSTFESGTAGYVLGIEIDAKPTRPPCRPNCFLE